MKGSFAVGEREDPAITDVRMACHSADGSGELVDMAVHTELAYQGLHVLVSMGAGRTLVVAQGRDPGPC